MPALCPHPQPLCLDSLIRLLGRRYANGEPDVGEASASAETRIAPKLGSVGLGCLVLSGIYLVGSNSKFKTS
jgi:hypothetical protein